MDKEKLDTTLQFYFNPIEQIRMLRYFPYQTKFDEEKILPFNYNEIYTSNNINIGVMIYITENTNPIHLELQLKSLIKLNNLTDKILFFYNKEKINSECLALISKYPIDRIEQKECLWMKEGFGDLNQLDFIYQGLRWANEKQLDIVVKIESELVGLYNWINDLANLAYQTDGITFNGYDNQIYSFRPECIGFNVKYWNNQTIKYSLLWLIQNKCTVELHTWLHELAKHLDGINYSEKYLKYKRDNQIRYIHSGYVTWLDLMGINDKLIDERHNNVLWKTYSNIEEYQKYVVQL